MIFIFVIINFKPFYYYAFRIVVNKLYFIFLIRLEYIANIHYTFYFIINSSVYSSHKGRPLIL